MIRAVFTISCDVPGCVETFELVDARPEPQAGWVMLEDLALGALVPCQEDCGYKHPLEVGRKFVCGSCLSAYTLAELAEIWKGQMLDEEGSVVDFRHHHDH